MPFELKPGEQAFFPTPFVPTEPNRLVVTGQRVVRFSADGPFPIGEIPTESIEFIGRKTERPYVPVAVVMGLLGLLLVIGGLWKVLPPVLHAGVVKDPKEEVVPDGRTKDDDFPTELDGGDAKKKLKEGAERLQKLRQVKLGVPTLTSDLALGLVMVLVGIGGAFGARALYRRRRYLVYCTAGGVVHPLEADSEQQQGMILGALQTSKQISKAMAPAK